VGGEGVNKMILNTERTTVTTEKMRTCAEVGYTVQFQFRVQVEVADCSRAEVGYTLEPQSDEVYAVADCSRAEVGYTPSDTL
jgi:hypothetical protein